MLTIIACKRGGMESAAEERGLTAELELQTKDMRILQRLEVADVSKPGQQNALPTMRVRCTVTKHATPLTL